MKKKKSKKLRIILILLILFLVIFGGIRMLSGKMNQTLEQMANTSQVETVKRRDLSDFISLTGTVEGASKTNVTSKANAEVKQVHVSVGDEVKEGDVLCTFDSKKIKEQISSAKDSIKKEEAISSNTKKQNKEALQDAKEAQQAELSSAGQSIQEAQEEYQAAAQSIADARALQDTKRENLAAAEKALKKAEKYAKKHPKDENGKKALEEANTIYASIQAEIDGLEQQIQETEGSLPELSHAISSAQNTYNSTKSATDKTIRDAQNTIDMEKYQISESDLDQTLKELKEQLKDCEILSPCSGVVTAVNISVGDQNTPGEVLLTIEDTSSMKINASVAEDDILRIEEGLPAIITTSATKEKEWNGSVGRVVRVKNKSTGSPEEGTVVSDYAAEINIPKSELLVGMNAKVKVILQEKKDVLAVPYDVIRTDEKEQTYVLLAQPEEDGSMTAVRCNVLTGDEVDYYTEIVGGDLQEGDQIVYDSEVMEGDHFTPELFDEDHPFGNDDASEEEVKE